MTSRGAPAEIHPGRPAGRTPAEHEGHDEDRECHRREAFEEKREHDRESITGLHEAEERSVLADDERRERADCDGDAGQCANDEDRGGHLVKPVGTLQLQAAITLAAARHADLLTLEAELDRSRRDSCWRR
jgi:hypothetical protein